MSDKNLKYYAYKASRSFTIFGLHFQKYSIINSQALNSDN